MPVTKQNVLNVGTGTLAVYSSLAANGFLVYDGKTWTDDPDAPTNVIDVWIDPATKEIFALQETGTASGGIWRHPFGSPWSASAAVAETGDFLWGLSSTDMWIVKNDSPGNTATLHHWDGTAGGGVTCTSCTIPNVVSGLWGPTSNNIYALAGTSVYHWNGVAWSALSDITLPAKSGAIDGTSTGDVYIGGGDGTLHHFDGTTWSTPFDVPFAIRGVQVFANDDIFITGLADRMYHFDGAHWYPVRLDVDGLDFLDGRGDTLFGVDGSGTVHRLVRSYPW
jgi:hypothetical protein